MKSNFPRFVLQLLPAMVLLALLPLPAQAQRQMEKLGRGVVALHSATSQAYIGWRLLATDPADVGFNLYRSANGGAGVKLNSLPLTNTTDFLDTSANFTISNAWYVVPVTNGVEGTPGAAFGLAANPPVRQYLSWPLHAVTGGGAPPYDVKFCWVGDLDGDGEYDYVVDRQSTIMATNQYLQAYKRDGTFLWQMDMGSNSVNQYNIEPGASAISVGDKDNVTVYDLDGDGRAEVCVRTARGVVLPDGTTVSGPDDTTQYLSILDGLTGHELARTTITNMWPADGPLNSHFGIMYCDGVHPSLVIRGENRNNSGGFQRETMTYDYRNGQLTRRWFHTPAAGANESWGHQIRIMDVNHDGCDDLIDVGSALNGATGQMLYDTELVHGDRFHITDIDPDRPGLEMFSIQQLNPTLLATAFIDMTSGSIIKKWYSSAITDVGRGIALDIDPNHRGLEFYSTQPGIFDCKGNQIQANNIWPPEGLWWDADLSREFIDGAGSGALNPVVNKYDPTSNTAGRMYSIYNEGVHQAYGGRPAFWGDILGDWREELVLVANDYSELRVYVSKLTATNRLYCLMQNPAYRDQCTCKGYYQASYVDYFLGNQMPPPPPPPVSSAKLIWHGDGTNVWDAATTANWFTNWFYVGNANTNPAPFSAGDTVLFDLTGSNNTAITLTGSLTPGDVRVHSPKNYVFNGGGSLAGAMALTKAGAGKLTFNGTNTYTGKTLIGEGPFIVNGSLPNSPVTVRGGVWLDGRLGGNGVVGSPVSIYEGAGVSPGPGTNSPGTLTISNNLTLAGRTLNDFDLSDDSTGLAKTNDLLNVTGNLTLQGTNTFVIRKLNATLPPGSIYPLINYSGALSGGLSNFVVAGLTGIPYALTNSPGQIALVVKSYRAPATLTWTGGQSGNAWDLLTSSNWLNGAVKDQFAPNDTVRFDNTGATNPTVNLSGDLNATSLVVDTTNNYTITGSGNIFGAASLTKTNSGTLTITAMNNSFTGKTTLSGGTLVVSELDAVGFPSPLGNPPSGSTNLILSGSPTLRVTSESYTDRGLTINAGTNTLDVTNSADQLTIAGVITGSGALQKAGAGTLAVSANNTFTGPTFISGGNLSLGGGTANQYGLGVGPGGNGNTTITISNATLTMFSDSGSYDTCYWNLIVPTNSAATISADDRCNLYGTLTGGGTLNFNVYYVRTELDGNWSAFTGQLNLGTSSAGGDFRIGNSSGYGNASVNLANYISAYHITSGSAVSLGAVSGGSLARMSGTVWTVGAKNTDATFAGTISGNSITKTGIGAWTLTGSNYYTGVTTVSAGTLFVNGDNHSASGTVSVGASGTLGGSGLIGGATTVNGKLSPGTTNGSIGTLTFSNNVTLASSSTAYIEINRTAGTKDLVNASGTITYGGTLQVTNFAGTLTNGDSFKLFNGSAYSGAFASKILPALSGSLAWDTSSLITNGTIKVVLSTTLPPVPAAPTNLIATAVSASQINLTWSDASTNEDNFLIEQSLDGTSFTQIASVGAGVTTFANTNLASSTAYYYRVRASNGGGSSAYSNIASATTLAGPVGLIWRGDGVGNVWDVNTTANWRSNNIASVFSDGAAIIFDDTGSNNVPVNLSATVSPGSVIVSATKNYNFSGSGVLSGAMALIKDGSGTLTLTTTNNTFSGGIVISNGTVQPASIPANITAWGTGPVTFMGGTVQFNGYGGNVGTGWGGMTNALIVPTGQTGTMLLPPRWGYSSPFSSPLTGGGTLNITVDYIRDYFTGNWAAFTGQINLTARSGSGDFVMSQDYSWPGLPNAAVNLGTNVNFYWSGNLNSGAGSFCDLGEVSGTASAHLSGGAIGGRILTYRVGGRNTDATYAGLISDQIAGSSTLITKLGSGTWILSGTNTYSGITTISAGTLQIGDNGTTGTLGTNNVVNNAVLDFNRADNLADSGVISGTGTVVQDGDGTVTFTRNHTYSGPTLINSGVLALSSGSSFSNSSAINIAIGATLDVSAHTGGSWTLTSGKNLTGNGSVNGNFIVASGAKLMPGNSIGTLIFNNQLTLAASSTTTMEISGSPLAGDQLKVFGTLACGGSLIVTNIGGTALAAGDSFKVIDAAVISSGFSGVILPALTGNLFWNTNNLLVDGTLTVAVPTPPVIGSISIAGTNFVFTGTGGTANANFYLIGATNLALPQANWTRLLTNQFDAAGNFQFTNQLNNGWLQGYYQLLVP